MRTSTAILSAGRYADTPNSTSSACRTLAKFGDLQAAKLILSYLLGKPVPATDPDRLDADEWACFHETAKMIKETPFLMGSVSPDLPLDLVRASRPGMSVGMARRLADIIQELDKAKEAKGRESQAPSTNGFADNGSHTTGKTDAQSANGSVTAVERVAGAEPVAGAERVAGAESSKPRTSPREDTGASQSLSPGHTGVPSTNGLAGHAAHTTRNAEAPSTNGDSSESTPLLQVDPPSSNGDSWSNNGKSGDARP